MTDKFIATEPAIINAIARNKSADELVTADEFADFLNTDEDAINELKNWEGIGGLFTRNIYENVTNVTTGKTTTRKIPNRERYAREMLQLYLKKKLDDQVKQRDAEIITDPEVIADVLGRKEQCILIESIPQISPFNFQHKYNNFYCAHDKTEFIVNKIAGPTLLEPLWSATPEKISRMQPTARLFKTFYDENKQEVDNVEIPFDEYVRDISYLTNSSVSQGAGAGMTSFTWKMQGSNPAESKNLIEVAIEIRFDSLQELARKRTVVSNRGIEYKVSFLDFFILPSKKSCRSGDYEVNGFSFKALVGWASVTGLYEMARKDEEAEMNKCLDADRKMLVLNMTNHNIDFEQEGPVTVTIEAMARLDVISWTNESNVFRQFIMDTDIPKIESEMDHIHKQSKCEQQRTTASSDESDKQIRDHRRSQIEKLEKELTTQKTLVWKGFITKLKEKSRLYSVGISFERLGFTYNSEGKLGLRVPANENKEKVQVVPEVYTGKTSFLIPPSDRNAKVGNEAVEKALTEQGKRALSTASQGTKKSTVIPFMFMGDIVEVALNSIQTKYNENVIDREIQTILGDVIYYDPVDRKRYSVNMADIPVSFKLFQDWFLHNVYSKQRVVYPVKEFITDLVTQLVLENFRDGECFVDTPTRKTKVSFSGFTMPFDGSTDPLNPSNQTRLHIDTIEQNKKASQGALKDGFKDFKQYQLIYVSDIVPHRLEADFSRDQEGGVPWVYIGRDRGIVESVSFTRIDIPFLRESRITQGNSEFSKLRERYKASIEMKGNNFFAPGQMIFINPSTIVMGSLENPASLARTMGLVGYYQILNVQSKIAAGEFQTTVESIWVASGAGEDSMDLGKVCDECSDINVDKDNSVKKVVDEIRYEDYAISPFRVVDPDFFNPLSSISNLSAIDRTLAGTIIQ